MIIIKDMKMPKGCRECRFLEPEVGIRCIAMGEDDDNIVYPIDEVMPDDFKYKKCPLRSVKKWTSTK